MKILTIAIWAFVFFYLGLCVSGLFWTATLRWAVFYSPLRCGWCEQKIWPWQRFVAWEGYRLLGDHRACAAERAARRVGIHSTKFLTQPWDEHDDDEDRPAIH